MKEDPLLKRIERMRCLTQEVAEINHDLYYSERRPEMEEPMTTVILGSDCYFCGARATGDRLVEPKEGFEEYKARLMANPDFVAGLKGREISPYLHAPVCGEHGGPRAPKPRPQNAIEVADRIRNELHRQGSTHMDDLVDGIGGSYADHGFCYGETAQGFLEWGYAQRYLADIPPCPPPQPNRFKRLLRT